MRKLFVPTLAALALTITACGGSDNGDDDANETSESAIVAHLNLEANDSSWTFTIDTDEACPVDKVLTTPVEVQSHENDGNVVAVNSAGSAGVVLPDNVTESCHDAAIELMSDL